MSKLNSIPLGLPADLHREVKRGAKKTGLSQADVMRHGLRIGLPLFVENFPLPMSRARQINGKGQPNRATKGENCME